MDVDIPREEIRFTIEFRTDDDGHDLNRLLNHFGLGDRECDVNQLLFPSSWPAGRLHDPPLSELAQGWVPWDEPLSSSYEVHIYVALLPLYAELASLSDMLHGHIQMVSSDTPLADRSQTLVVIRQIPLILLVELVSQLSQQVRVLEHRLQIAETSIQLLRQHLGI
jgi:hypothetical protein